MEIELLAKLPYNHEEGGGRIFRISSEIWEWRELSRVKMKRRKDLEELYRLRPSNYFQK